MISAPLRDPGLRVRSIRYRGFKALREFDVSLRHLNVLVGPNNAGKSTIIDSLRLLAAGMRVAWYRPPERIRDHEGIDRQAYQVPVQLLSVTTENVHSDYDESIPALVSFELSNGTQLRIHFPPGDDTCWLIPITDGAYIRTPSQFRRAFPLDIRALPVLGPLEYHERIVTRETLNSNLATRRASRSFRNYWYRSKSGDFERFAALVTETWPGVEISPPELSVTMDETWLSMFCMEDRLPGEIYWAGFGFQVWCQVLTHLLRSTASSLVALDEAELYLHPELQRQLLAVLRSLGPDVLIATHSSEIAAEADPDEVVLVDKKLKRAKRVTGAEGVRAALISLGSNRSLVLTQLARTKKGLLVEGEDFKIVRAFARTLGLDRLATGLDFAVIPLGGFREPRSIRLLAEGMALALGEQPEFAVILDRDYRSRKECEDLSRAFRWARLGHVLFRKEIENYLLVPDVLDKAIRKTEHERAARLGTAERRMPPAETILREVLAALRPMVQENSIRFEIEYEASRTTGMNNEELADLATERFDERWKDEAIQLEMVPGKEALSRFNAVIQERHQISLTPTRIAGAFGPADIPPELSSLLTLLEAFRLGRDPREA